MSEGKTTENAKRKVAVLIVILAGIANRAIRPMLGIVDPLHTLHMSERLTANSGYDVLW